MKLLSALLICICLSACISSKAKKETMSLLEQINPATGEYYTADEVKEIKKIDESDKLIDRLLGNKILLLYAAGSLLCIAGGVIAGYRGRMDLVLVCGGGALACALLPACIALFWSAGQIILYIVGVLLVICSGIVIWWLWRKMEQKHKAAELKHVVNKELVETIEEIKSAYPKEWQVIRKSIENLQSEITVNEVKSLKK